MKEGTRIPLIRSWVERTLAAHEKDARPVADLIEPCGLRRLPGYFDTAFLARVRCAAVDRVPMPPLASLGLKRFTGFETTRWAGITYGDIYFVDRRFACSESLHFHELIHAVQWDCLGFDRFILAYARGLLREGYARSPLEVMACRHQRRFETDPVPYPAEALVREEIASRFPRRA
ncbi:MAG: hypothetical protein KBH73_06785 [Syntrophobacterales bacterium]|nr:hypothetical protein [Syntrophobacterales bacterium]